MKEKEILEIVLAQAGIALNGSAAWDMQVHDDRLYGKLSRDLGLVLGESYVDGAWDCPRLDQFFAKLLRTKGEEKILRHPAFWSTYMKQIGFTMANHLINFQRRKNAFKTKMHYDLGNNLFEAMLGQHMIYTCGYWRKAQDLDTAQIHKLTLSCDKLSLKPGMKVLDVGCGWGTFAKFAAENYGVTVVGITISKPQYEYAVQHCQGLPIKIRLQDYRDLEVIQEKESYDRIVSLGMFEHVGHKNYTLYMNILSQLLKSEGLFLLHSIGANAPEDSVNAWINTYIFPQGELPTIAEIGKSIENIFVMEDWHNFGSDYDKTLMAWYHNFHAHWETLKPSYDERFYRMWKFYLLLCAGSFRARKNQLWQILLSKNGLPQGVHRLGRD